MHNTATLSLIVVIIALYYYMRVYKYKEGIVFTRDYMKEKYKNADIILDKKNSTLEKDGRVVKYRGINNADKGKITNNKSLAKAILDMNNIPTPRAYTWVKELSQAENLQHLKALKFPLVVKPVNGERGYGVMTDLMTATAVCKHVETLLALDKEVLIEEQIKGKEYRIMVFNGNIVGITQKMPPTIIGDGNHNIKELVKAYNKDRSKLFRIHTVDYPYIQTQGYAPTDILTAGKRLVVNNVSNMSNGATIAYIDINQVHPDNIGLFKKINDVLGLKLSGIDYIGEDLIVPYYLDGAVIEVNPSPGLEIHYNITPEHKQDSLLDNVLSILFDQ